MYNETIQDLLAPPPSSTHRPPPPSSSGPGKGLDVRVCDGGVFVEGLTRREVCGMEDVDMVGG